MFDDSTFKIKILSVLEMRGAIENIIINEKAQTVGVGLEISNFYYRNPKDLTVLIGKTLDVGRFERNINIAGDGIIEHR